MEKCVNSPSGLSAENVFLYIFLLKNASDGNDLASSSCSTTNKVGTIPQSYCMGESSNYWEWDICPSRALHIRPGPIPRMLATEE